jgi:5-methylcytosine-specific restriction endonuclease McrA
MSASLFRTISNEYKSNQRKRRKAIRKFAFDYFKLAAAGTPGLWGTMYKDTHLGPKVHSAIRSHLTQLTNRCGYCQERIFHNANVNIDHILPKVTFPQFTFSVENLVAACVTCNAIKAERDFYGLAPGVMNYSQHNGSWSCFHPRLHTYDDHIRLISVQTNHFHVRAFIGKTPEGISLCNQFLNKVTEFGTKAQANPQIAQAVNSLETLLASSGPFPTPAVQKLLSSLVANI